MRTDLAGEGLAIGAGRVGQLPKRKRRGYDLRWIVAEERGDQIVVVLGSGIDAPTDEDSLSHASDASDASDDQTADPFVLRGRDQGDDRAHRVADETEALELERISELQYSSVAPDPPMQVLRSRQPAGKRRAPRRRGLADTTRNEAPRGAMRRAERWRDANRFETNGSVYE